MSLCGFARVGSYRTWYALLGGYAAAIACTSSPHPPSEAAPTMAPSSPPVASARPAAPPAAKPETPRPHSKATRLAVGSDRSCAILEDRTVACWGGMRAHSTPRRIVGLNDVVDVAFAHGIVALRSDGTVVVADEDRSAPRTLGLLTGVTRVSGEGTWVHGGGDKVCAIVAEGRVICYPSGPLDRDTGTENRGVPVRGVQGATDLVVDDQNACALVAGGELRCWSTVGDPRRPPFFAYSLPAIKDAISLSLGASSVCVRRVDGSATCSELSSAPKISHDLGKVDALGMAQESQYAPSTCFARGLALECQQLEDLGMSSPLTSPAAGPVPASELGRVVQIGMNRDAACALDDRGLVACWGSNEWGRLGRPDVAYLEEPTQVPNLPKAAQVAVGHAFSCALTTDGHVWCWGQEDNDEHRGPHIERVPGLDRVKRIFASDAYACAEDNAGEVRCFVGLESTEHKRTPSRVPALDGTRAVAIEAAPRWAAALSKQGELLLGTLPGSPSRPPPTLDGLTLAPVPGLSGIQRVVSYFNYLVALDRDGKVFVGRIDDGKLAKKMKHVPALDGAVDVAFGRFLFPGGQIRGWSYADPEKISVHVERSNLVSLLEGGPCGRTAAGDVVCFRPSGEEAMLNGMKSSSGDGETHVCGVDAQGDVFCRGANRAAQCGVRIGFESSATPLTVMLP